MSSEEDPFYLSCSSVKPHCMKIKADNSETITDVPLEQEDNVCNLKNFGVRMGMLLLMAFASRARSNICIPQDSINESLLQHGTTTHLL